MTLAEAAERVGVTPATLRRWAREGLVPQFDGSWTTAAVGHARVVHRMRERGHSLEQIRRATEQGRLAFGYIEDLFPSGGRGHTLAEASAETGLEPALIERVVIVGDDADTRITFDVAQEGRRRGADRCASTMIRNLDQHPARGHQKAVVGPGKSRHCSMALILFVQQGQKVVGIGEADSHDSRLGAP